MEGRPPDARTDLWALGAIIYEMVTGKRAFEASSTVSLIAAILEHEPPAISSLHPLTPPALDRLVRDCRAKSPDDRPDTAHDVAKELSSLRQLSGLGQSVGVKRPGGARVTLIVASVLVVAAATAGAAITFLLRPTPSAAPRLAARLSVDVRPAEELATSQGDVAGQGGARLLAVPFGPRADDDARTGLCAAEESRDSPTILRGFKTLLVDASKAKFFGNEQVKAALGRDKGFAALKIAIVDDRTAADIVLEVGYTFAWDYPFSLKHQNSSVVLVSGKGAGPFSGPAGAKSVASELVKLLKPYRVAMIPAPTR